MQEQRLACVFLSPRPHRDPLSQASEATSGRSLLQEQPHHHHQNPAFDPSTTFVMFHAIRQIR